MSGIASQLPLGQFDPISLKEMDEVALLDRTDTKFAFAEKELPGILEVLKKHYRILEVNSLRSTQYETLYYDSSDFEFYLRHHNEKLNRFKTRYRRYVESDLVFFEIKFKSNKGRTLKKRVRLEKISETMGKPEEKLFIETTGLSPEGFSPRLWVNYNRITLVSRKLDERLTIDTSLNFISGPEDTRKTEIKMEPLVIAEVKQKKVSFTSPFVRLMHTMHKRKLSVSKYCMGVASLHREIKQNNFKSKFLIIQKIQNGNRTSNRT